MESVRIEARYVIAGPEQIHAPGQVEIRDGRVAEVVGRRQFRTPDIALPCSVVAPALINAHTHLEFSLLDQPIPAGASFPMWISRVVAYRRSAWEQSGDREDASRHFRRSALRGLAEAVNSGTGLLADICSMPWQPSDLPLLSELSQASAVPHSSWLDGRAANALRAGAAHFPVAPMHVIELPEVIGLTPPRLQQTLHWAQGLVAAERGPDLLAGYGMSPHAPYSVSAVEVPAAFAPSSASVWAMHLAESRDELRWIESGEGPFRDSFEKLGLPLDGARLSIDAALDMLQRVPRALVVHGNYLSPEQFKLVGRHPGMTVVYCPRTHSHFDHQPYPLPSIQAAGCRLVMGTDSRASNPDLNLWREVVAARRKHPSLAPACALASVTSEAAAALGVAAQCGTLTPGKTAKLIHAPCPDVWTRESLLEELTGGDPGWQPLHPLLLAAER